MYQTQVGLKSYLQILKSNHFYVIKVLENVFIYEKSIRVKPSSTLVFASVYIIYAQKELKRKAEA